MAKSNTDPWDDSALINAFDSAIRKYKAMHVTCNESSEPQSNKKNDFSSDAVEELKHRQPSEDNLNEAIVGSEGGSNFALSGQLENLTFVPKVDDMPVPRQAQAKASTSFPTQQPLPTFSPALPVCGNMWPNQLSAAVPYSSKFWPSYAYATAPTAPTCTGYWPMYHNSELGASGEKTSVLQQDNHSGQLESQAEGSHAAKYTDSGVQCETGDDPQHAATPESLSTPAVMHQQHCQTCTCGHQPALIPVIRCCPSHVHSCCSHHHTSIPPVYTCVHHRGIAVCGHSEFAGNEGNYIQGHVPCIVNSAFVSGSGGLYPKCGCRHHHQHIRAHQHQCRLSCGHYRQDTPYIIQQNCVHVPQGWHQAQQNCCHTFSDVAVPEHPRAS